jgi:hypothetical protein
MRSLWRRIIAFLLSIGRNPGELPEQQARRRIFVVASTIATLLSVPFIFNSADLGHTRIGVADTLLAHLVRHLRGSDHLVDGHS